MKTPLYYKTTYLLILLLLMSNLSIFAQKKVISKSWEVGASEGVVIFDDLVSKIHIISVNSNEIELTAAVEGEFSEPTMIRSKRKNGLLYLGSTFSPYFQKIDDKLAAHKVQSVELVLKVPEHLSVTVSSKLASIYTTGKFSKLNIETEEGSCELLNFEGYANVLTKNGSIRAFAMKNVSGQAVSKHGIVVNELSEYGIYRIEAESWNGNIWLLKTQ